MSEKFSPEILRNVSPETKARIKKALPIVAVVIVLLIIISVVTSGGGSGKSANKEAIKLLQKQNPKKILSVMPDGYVDDVIEYYGGKIKTKKQLSEAIKNRKVFSKFQELGDVKKVKIVENFEVNLSDLAHESLSMMEEADIKDAFNSVKAEWDVASEILNEGYATKIEITYKDENGDKQTEDYMLCSVKYDGKWYSLNCMNAVLHSIWGYEPPRS